MNRKNSDLFIVMMLAAVMIMTVFSFNITSANHSGITEKAVSANADALPEATTSRATRASAVTVAHPTVITTANADFAALTTASPSEFSLVSGPTTTTTVAMTPTPLTISSDEANVRSDANAGAKLLRVVHKGERYTVVSQKRAPNGVLWFCIDLGEGQLGYICCSYVHYEGIILGGRAYLTFDDGPSANTIKILDILDKYNAKATFFVIYSKDYKDLYSEIIRRGHTLALHSYSHEYSKIYRSEQEYFADLNKLSDYIYSLTGYRSKIIRFPGGASNTVSKKYCRGIMTRLTKSVTEQGYYYFDWDADSGDASGNHISPDKLVSNTKISTGSKAEVTLLMHDAAAKDTTVEALPRIIEYYQSRGYRLLPITEDTTAVHHTVLN